MSVDTLREIAQTALREVAEDKSAPAAARAQAARTLLEMVGAIGRHASPKDADGDGRDLAGLSRDELLAEMARLRRDRSSSGS